MQSTHFLGTHFCLLLGLADKNKPYVTGLKCVCTS